MVGGEDEGDIRRKDMLTGCHLLLLKWKLVMCGLLVGWRVSLNLGVTSSGSVDKNKTSSTLRVRYSACAAVNTQGDDTPIASEQKLGGPQYRDETTFIYIRRGRCEYPHLESQ